eukprot:m.36290 g.36290  ORF g.36290 m.36290 type:complete len:51 (-) comp10080_c0_seq5:2699-2851(-)
MESLLWARQQAVCSRCGPRVIYSGARSFVLFTTIINETHFNLKGNNVCQL